MVKGADPQLDGPLVEVVLDLLAANPPQPLEPPLVRTPRALTASARGAHSRSKDALARIRCPCNPPRSRGAVFFRFASSDRRHRHLEPNLPLPKEGPPPRRTFFRRW